jgi:hypothetical protein
MISLTIISSTSKQSNEIIHLLLKKRLVIAGTIQKNIKCFRLDIEREVNMYNQSASFYQNR